MFALAFFAMFLLVVAYVALSFSVACFQEEEGVPFMVGLVLLAVGCAFGAWSFMLFVHAAQLA